MMRKVVVIGANGQLGTDLVKELGKWKTEEGRGKGKMENGGRKEDSIFHFPSSDFLAIPLTHKDIEICDHAGTREILTRLEPDVVINTAAYHRVDECEAYPEKAFQVNAIAVRNLALVCRDMDAVLVHMSTDYVFGGDRNRRTPYTEDDTPWPLNVYGASKLAGEYFVRNLCPKHFVVRSSGLYGAAGSSGKGGNFVELMIRLAREGKQIRVVDDQVLTPTYTEDLAKKIVELVETDYYGIFHVTNKGECSWYEFAQAIFHTLEMDTFVDRTTTEAFGARAMRPKYSVLRHGALEAIGRDHIRPRDEALKSYLQARLYEETSLRDGNR